MYNYTFLYNMYIFRYVVLKKSLRNEEVNDKLYHDISVVLCSLIATINFCVIIFFKSETNTLPEVSLFNICVAGKTFDTGTKHGFYTPELVLFTLVTTIFDILMVKKMRTSILADESFQEIIDKVIAVPVAATIFFSANLVQLSFGWVLYNVIGASSDYRSHIARLSITFISIYRTSLTVLIVFRHTKSTEEKSKRQEQREALRQKEIRYALVAREQRRKNNFETLNVES